MSDPTHIEATESSSVRCAICHTEIENGESGSQWLGGVHGRGLVHADPAKCMEALRGADPYGD